VNIAKFQRPSRYIGHEVNAVRGGAADVTVALAFPDIYDVGMSHLGLKILYDILNRIPGVRAERAFHPWVDYEAAMREAREPLRTVETGMPVRDCDLLGVSLQYELCYTTVLSMLDLAGIPLRSAERTARDPIVMGGGPCAVNPAPIAPFFDALMVGEAEEAVVEIAEVMRAWRTTGDRSDRAGVLRALSAIEGVYVPAIHGDRPGCVRRRLIPSLAGAPYPVAPVVPYTAVVHDRVMVEVARGCAQGCRFCQAGMIYRPMRERPAAEALRLAEEAVRRTGYEEISFSSLSAGDYSGLPELLRGFNRLFAEKRIAISLPSLRVKSVTENTLREIVSVRKTGFTIAPEAATDRLRRVINKDFAEEDYERALELLFKAGWLNLKLYFMLGLPGERPEDIEAIPAMVMKAVRTAKRHTRRFVNVSVSLSPYVPKAHTPFQWFGQAPVAYFDEWLRYLKGNLRKITVRDHDVRTSRLEAVFARGDGRLADLVEAAYRAGARLDAWSETFSEKAWDEALDRTGVDPGAYATREIGTDEALPWDVVDIGIDKEFMLRERERAFAEEYTESCITGCAACGLECAPVATPEPAPARRQAPAPGGPPRRAIRVRALFRKTGPLRHLSHRELMTHVTRALRRAGVRLDHTQGFHPTPKVAFGPPLGVGVAGLNEYFDVELFPGTPLETVREALNRELGEGVSVRAMEPVAMDAPSLQGFATRYLYEITAPSLGGLRAFERAEAFPVQRETERGRARTVDLRPQLLGVTYVDERTARLVLADREGATVRLDEFARHVLGSAIENLEITRLALHGPGGEPVAPFGETCPEVS
jgi:radical SAM family uncharacterized protein/radical SAM-linked protein